MILILLYIQTSCFSVLKNSAQYFGVSALSLHFENVPSIDVVSSRTPQTIRNYNRVINVMYQFSKLATHVEFKNKSYLRKLFPSHQMSVPAIGRHSLAMLLIDGMIHWPLSFQILSVKMKSTLLKLT